ncbi:hypothetical protein CCACVL1_26737 [Corchorus capsularis]|uniref:Transmembrane protein n=1 Tax=Corchorus capsularis TaxID=210143 RepID=A0A1R3GDG6_COCAP|nr:hypothetical protein CCACVL1_26737 [Corchorus capsularis]
MSIVFQNLFTPSPPRLLKTYLKNPTSFPPITSRHLSLSISNSQDLHFRTRNLLNFKSTLRASSHFILKAYDSDSSIAASPEENPDFNDFNLDSFLSFAEFLCIFSSAVVSVVYAVLGWKGIVLGGIWRGLMVFGAVGLVGGVAIGAWIRRRQWRRICVETVKGRGNLNLIERIEKLEEDMRSSATIIRALSRQLEKLGIRFRVTRKALKDPIAETAALAQKNSEATRALAVQEDILEKELGEIQKVLLAMQEQQQKQLELILAIGKSGKLFEDKQEPTQEKRTVESSKFSEEPKQVESHQTQPLSTRKGSGNDRT